MVILVTHSASILSSAMLYRASGCTAGPLSGPRGLLGIGVGLPVLLGTLGGPWSVLPGVLASWVDHVESERESVGLLIALAHGPHRDNESANC